MKTSSTSTSQVFGPDGSILTPVNLPSDNHVRWSPRRKAEIVAAIRGGLLSVQEASVRYQLSSEELLNWAQAYDRDGLRGLTTRRRSIARTDPGYPLVG